MFKSSVHVLLACSLISLFFLPRLSVADDAKLTTPAAATGDKPADVPKPADATKPADVPKPVEAAKPGDMVKETAEKAAAEAAKAGEAVKAAAEKAAQDVVKAAEKAKVEAAKAADAAKAEAAKAADAMKAAAEKIATGAKAAVTGGAEKGALLFPNSDFELGTLDHWNTEGDAFAYQPTKGDNARGRGKPAMPEGTYWVGTYEKYQGKDNQKVGAIQGDKPKGGLVSQTFGISGPYISFLIGGGNGAHTNVQLVVDGNPIYTEVADGAEAMRRVYWDVQKFKDRNGLIYIVDEDSEPFGHINVDDFRYANAIPDTLLFENSDFEKGDLTNWTAEGDAFKFQPTKGDNVAVRHPKPAWKANPKGLWWVGTYEKYQGKEGQKPGEAQEEDPQGELKSVPFTIKSKLITFLIGGSNKKSDGVRLIVDGKEVATAFGNAKEEMHYAAWDVKDYIGKSAQIVVLDKSTGAWGHINVDDFRYGRPE